MLHGAVPSSTSEPAWPVYEKELRSFKRKANKWLRVFFFFFDWWVEATGINFQFPVILQTLWLDLCGSWVAI